MATYVIGDIQGCNETLRALLRRIKFAPGVDRVWLVGDIVNRGPRSLEVLRWARAQKVTAVLGNHDLHLLAASVGARKAKERDTLQAVLAADDCDELLDWLRQLPLLHRERKRVLVHAGIFPGWTVDVAEFEAREVEAKLRGPGWKNFVRSLYARTPPRTWNPRRRGIERLRFAVTALTRLRTCKADGSLDTNYDGPPESAPAGLIPWFEHPSRASTSETIVCGHWASMGLRLENGLVALDTGCVWGRTLTAYRLDDHAVFQEPSRDT